MAYKDKEKQRIYQKEFRIKNKEKIRKYMRNYEKAWREAHREELREYMREYWKRNREKLNKQHQERREKDKEGYRAKERARYQKRKEELRERRKELRLKVISYYSQGKNECACCGERHIEFLSINHIEGNGRNHRLKITGGRYRAGSNFYRWLIRNNYPEGYNVLCMNCNFALGKYGYCPHKRTVLIR